MSFICQMKPLTKKINITVEYLKEILEYCPYSGLFTWKSRIKGSSYGPGDLAGSKHKSGYIQIKIHGTLYKAHRLAWFYMTGKWPSKEIDHINRVKDDNRWVNLREATHSQNQLNVIRRPNKSGHPGVYETDNGKWRVVLQINNKRFNLGTYLIFDEAVNVYKKFVGELKQEFNPNV